MLRNDYYPTVELVCNDAKVPIRCTPNVNIIVKETVATGALNGSVH